MSCPILTVLLAILIVAGCTQALGVVDLAVVDYAPPPSQEQVDTCSLGYKHMSDEGDVHLGVDLLRKCGEMGGHEGAKAYNYLANMYLDGVKVKRDYQQAYDAFVSGSALGDPESQRFLAFLASTGIYFNATVNHGESVLNYFFAATGGDIVSNLALGFRHKIGYGTPKVCDASVYYYELAANNALKQKGMRDILTVNDIVPLETDSQLKRKGVSSTPDDIVQYFQQLADSGDVSAQVAYGQLLYHGGRGVAQDYATAASYFQNAANAGDMAAMSNLGQMYSNGLGVPQNNETALAYFKKAAEAGHAAAMTGLGVYYLYGYGGLTKNVTKAFKLFESAAEQGHIDAYYKLGVMALNGVEEIRQDTQAALLYFKRAAHGGHAKSMYQVGQMHQFEVGTEKSCTAAVQLYKIVAEASPVIIEIANKAHNSIIDGDEGHAVLLYALLADAGIETAAHNAAFLLDKGVSVNNSLGSNLTACQSHAVLFLKLSYDQNNMKSCLKLGDYYYYGLGGLNVSMESAAQYYQVASEHHIAQAMWNLGYMHENGLGMEKDTFLAKRYYDACASTDRDGNIVASLSLAKWWANYYFNQWFGKEPATTPSGDRVSQPAEPIGNSNGSFNFGIVGYDLMIEDLMIAVLVILILVIVVGCA